MSYINPYLLLILPLLIFLMLNFIKWKKNKQNIFAEPKFHNQIFGKTSFLNKIIPWGYILAILFLVLAMLNLSTENNEKIEINQKNSNVLFLIDVSNSMNAQDVDPSRLGLAKDILNQTINKLENERVGIVLFAGEARSIMPLTTDYSSANIFLDNINSNFIQKQGTDFFLAVEESIKKLNNAPSGEKKIILISDGEDNEGNHNNAIQKAKSNNISITTVGIGTQDGAPIPEYTFENYQDYKRDEYGQIIITKRELNALKSIAKKTNGVFIDGNNPSKASEKIINDIKKTQKNNHTNTTTIKHTTHYYQWFLGISIFLFICIYLFNPKKDLNF